MSERENFPKIPSLRPRQSTQTSAFSLVEVTLAIGVTAFCLLAIFGLLPIGLNASHSAIEQTGASSIISLVTTDLRATRLPVSGETNSTVSPQFGISIPQNSASSTSASATLFFTGDGKLSPSETDARYRVLVTFPPRVSADRSATCIALQVSWPASVTAASANGRVQTFVALDRN